jgi:hypothetical protein
MLVKTVPALGFIEFCVEAPYMDEKELSRPEHDCVDTFILPLVGQAKRCRVLSPL